MRRGGAKRIGSFSGSSIGATADFGLLARGSGGEDRVVDSSPVAQPGENAHDLKADKAELKRRFLSRA